MHYQDRVKETSTTTGTGNVTLAGAASAHITFAAAFAIGEPFYYLIVGQTGTEWEVGRGTLSGATTLVRTTVESSSNAGALVNFSAGTKDVMNVIAAKRMNRGTTRGEQIASNTGLDMP